LSGSSSFTAVEAAQHEMTCPVDFTHVAFADFLLQRVLRKKFEKIAVRPPWVEIGVISRHDWWRHL